MLLSKLSKVQLTSRIIYLLDLITTLGKKNEYIYNFKDLSFYVRRGTSDKYCVNEILKKKDYTIKIKENATIVDIGANIGLFTVYSAKKATKGKVFSFEPEPRNHQQLIKNTKLNNLENVFIYNKGLLGESKKCDLFLSYNDGAHSIYFNPIDSKKEKIEIECITLEDVFKKCKLNKIDILKIDCEGAEFDIIFSSTHLLDKIDTIILEFHNNLNKKYNHKDLVNLLEKHNFKVEIKSSSLYINLFKIGVLKATKELV